MLGYKTNSAAYYEFQFTNKSYLPSKSLSKRVDLGQGWELEAQIVEYSGITDWSFSDKVSCSLDGARNMSGLGTLVKSRNERTIVTCCYSQEI